MHQGKFFEELSLGMEASYSRLVMADDILAYANVTGDDNPMHVNEAYAVKTQFKGRIAHGMLTAGYLSTIFGTQLPGPGCIYVSQTLNFRNPVRIGDEVTAKVVVTELLPAKRRVIFACDCSVAGKPVLHGHAVLMVPARAA